jgi:hypothetical protein
MHHGKISPAIARGLQELSVRIKKAKIPPSMLDETLTIATWNIREFGRRKRLDASLHYIAEILGQFDLISIVELRDDVSELETVLSYMGNYWRVVYSDYITDAGGNRERIAYVYDKRAVVFTGLASHAAAPRKKQGGEWVSSIGWWRPPYMASFSSGNFDFVLLSAHIRWGSGGEAERVSEIELLADWVSTRAKAKAFGNKDVLVVGDFNIPTLQGPMYKALRQRDLQMPKALAGITGSNLAKSKRYDQILHLPCFKKSFTGRGGIVDFYEGDHRPLFAGLPAAKNMTKEKFTYELSDHLPLWIQINTDNDEEEREPLL